jgi:hypothetical protein
MMKRLFSDAALHRQPALARTTVLLPLVLAAQLPACAVALAAGGLRDGLLALLMSVVCAAALAAYARPAAPGAPAAPAAPAPPPAAAAEDDTKLYVRRLRHDLRGALSPAMLTADRLLSHPDATARRYGEVICQSVERAAQLLETPTP